MLSTFSIVAYDPAAGQWGVAVQSKFLAAGAVVPFAQAGVGAVASQANANGSFGPRGLALLAQGLAAEEVVRQLLADDPLRDTRQLGVVDSQGRAAAHTGQRCMDWAGHHVGSGYCCQGNILAGAAVVAEMARAFESTGGMLGGRLVAALEAGQAAGGDRRGQQAAGLLVVQVRGGLGGYNDRLIDLRVDEHATPIAELKRILVLQQLYFGKTRSGGPATDPRRACAGDPTDPAARRFLHWASDGRVRCCYKGGPLSVDSHRKPRRARTARRPDRPGGAGVPAAAI